MATINPYLIFNGNCEEAFLFYQSVFGGEFPYVGKFKDMPSGENTPPLSEEDANKIMHIRLPMSNGTELMGSDSNSVSGAVVFGGNVSLSINAESRKEADHLFNGFICWGKSFYAYVRHFLGCLFRNVCG